MTADGQSLSAWGMGTSPWSVSFLAILSGYDFRGTAGILIIGMSVMFVQRFVIDPLSFGRASIFCCRSGNIQHSVWSCELVHWRRIDICCIPGMPAAQCDAWREILCLAAGSLLPSSYGRSSCLTGSFCGSHHHYSMCSNHSLCSTIALASAAFRAHTHQVLSKSHDIGMSVIGFSYIVVHSKSCHLYICRNSTVHGRLWAIQTWALCAAVHGCCTPVNLFVKSPPRPATMKHLWLEVLMLIWISFMVCLYRRFASSVSPKDKKFDWQRSL